jgi:basic membrane protein A
MELKQRSMFEWAMLLGLFFFISALGASLWYFSNDKDIKKPVVGIVLLGDRNEEGWNAPQYRGMKKACDAMGVELLVSDNNSGLDRLKHGAYLYRALDRLSLCSVIIV